MGEYSDKLQKLYESNESKPGLVRTVELLKRLGNPQNSLKCVHVAGTNGKGSTCAYIESVARAAGYKTGLFTSPSIHDIREYIRLDNEIIDEDKFEEYAKSALEICEKMTGDGFEHPTFFEIITAMAFDFFEDSEAEIVVIETGLGGKTDATNVIYPILSVITRISYDHMGVLGDTIAKIAEQKAGIIKAKIPVIIAPNQPKSAYRIIQSACKSMDADLIDAGDYDIEIYDMSPGETAFTAQYGKGMYRFRVKNTGLHQCENAVTALNASELLEHLGFDKIGYSAIKKGINSAHLEGRLEFYPDKKILVDVSHNQDGVSELGAALNELFPDEKIVLLCSVLNTKDIDAMAYEYSRFVTYAYVTRAQSSMAAVPEDIVTAFKKHTIECEAEEDLAQACKSAAEKSTSESAYLVISGSFYMISAVKKELELDILQK